MGSIRNTCNGFGSQTGFVKFPELMTSSPFDSPYFSGLREGINARLEKSVAEVSGCPDTLRESMHYSLLAGGKRLRPILSLVACETCGGDREAALPVACAIEMVHTYSLIHDDLPAMDDDDLRRGHPTNHKVYGEAMAILAGDALLTLAFETIVVGLPSDVAAECVLDLAVAGGRCGMVGGQTVDMQAEEQSAAGAEFSVDQLEGIHKRKTGKLLQSALTMGGRVARAGEKQLFALESFGERVGLAFQIADDLLDIRGDAQKIGKRVGKDSDAGKLTYPGLLGLEESQVRAEQLIREACDALDVFDNAEHLRQLAKFVLKREQ